MWTLNNSKCADFLLDARTKDGTALSESSIYNELRTFIGAGFETTGIAISFALFLMACHPEIQRKAQEEVDAIFGDDVDTFITVGHLTQMTYLECCLKEAMRL